MTPQERDRLLQKEDARHKRTVDAIHITFDLSQEDSDSTSDTAPVAANGPPRRQRRITPGGRGSILRTVKNWVEASPDKTFTILDVEKFLPGTRRGTLKTLLKRLTDKGYLEVVFQGRARNPSVYRYKDNKAKKT
jgi:hypothetical protein